MEVEMKNKDSHNYDYGHVRGVKVQESEKWGRSAALRRYGESRSPDMKAKDQSGPQRLGDSNNLRGPGWANDVANDWRRGANEDGRPPNFDRGKR
jgi:hypothetical protein